MNAAVGLRGASQFHYLEFSISTEFSRLGTYSDRQSIVMRKYYLYKFTFYHDITWYVVTLVVLGLYSIQYDNMLFNAPQSFNCWSLKFDVELIPIALSTSFSWYEFWPAFVSSLVHCKISLNYCFVFSVSSFFIGSKIPVLCAFLLFSDDDDRLTFDKLSDGVNGIYF